MKVYLFFFFILIWWYQQIVKTDVALHAHTYSEVFPTLASEVSIWLEMSFEDHYLQVTR